MLGYHCSRLHLGIARRDVSKCAYGRRFGSVQRGIVSPRYRTFTPMFGLELFFVSCSSGFETTYFGYGARTPGSNVCVQHRLAVPVVSVLSDLLPHWCSLFCISPTVSLGMSRDLYVIFRARGLRSITNPRFHHEIQFLCCFNPQKWHRTSH